jgi:hypothetical protein
VRGGAQITQICTLAGLPGPDGAAAQLGGYTRAGHRSATTLCDQRWPSTRPHRVSAAITHVLANQVYGRLSMSCRSPDRLDVPHRGMTARSQCQRRRIVIRTSSRYRCIGWPIPSSPAHPSPPLAVLITQAAPAPEPPCVTVDYRPAHSPKSQRRSIRAELSCAQMHPPGMPLRPPGCPRAASPGVPVAGCPAVWPGETR